MSKAKLLWKLVGIYTPMPRVQVMPEAASAVMTDAANNGLRFVIAVTDPLNAASQRVCERLGMRSLGVTEAYYDEHNLLFEKTLSR